MVSCHVITSFTQSSQSKCRLVDRLLGHGLRGHVGPRDASTGQGVVCAASPWMCRLAPAALQASVGLFSSWTLQFPEPGGPDQWDLCDWPPFPRTLGAGRGVLASLIGASTGEKKHVLEDLSVASGAALRSVCENHSFTTHHRQLSLWPHIVRGSGISQAAQSSWSWVPCS